MANRLRLAILVLGVVLTASAAAAFANTSVAPADIRTGATFDKSAGALHESTAPVAATSRPHTTKSYRAARALAVLAAAWAVVLVGLWLTRSRLRVNRTLPRLVSAHPRGPPLLLHVS
jgi:hypothetical protein